MPSGEFALLRGVCSCHPCKPDPLARLTPHEYSVLSLIGEGLTNRQIGERLFIAEKTVKTGCCWAKVRGDGDLSPSRAAIRLG